MGMAVATEELGTAVKKKKKYQNWKRGTEPFFPNEMVFMAQVVLTLLSVVFIFVFFLTEWLLPPDEMANPLVTPEHIKPEWYFLAAYQTLKLVPREDIGIYIQLAVLAIALLLPFWDRGKERNVFKRPVILLLGFTALGLLAGLTSYAALQ
jgi:ubiquinol-cytochrome c reductase cytochrome b subunit